MALDPQSLVSWRIPRKIINPDVIVLWFPINPPHQTEGAFFENYLEGDALLSSGFFNGFYAGSRCLAADRSAATQRKFGVPDKLWRNLVVLPCMPFIALTSLPTNEESPFWILGAFRKSLLCGCDFLHYLYPDLKITVVKANNDKLQLFNSSLMDQRVDRFDQRFGPRLECTAGHANQPSLLLIILSLKGNRDVDGVSDVPGRVNTRDKQGRA